MGRTVTVEEAKSRTAYDLIQEAAQTQQPLIVMLKNGETMAIKPLMTLSGSVPSGWRMRSMDGMVQVLRTLTMIGQSRPGKRRGSKLLSLVKVVLRTKETIGNMG